MDSTRQGPPVFAASEIEFLAEETLIRIVPLFDMDVLSFIGGEFGPFIANLPTEVPLWLAIQLGKAKKCRIELPRWLKVAQLREVLERERSDDQYFSDMHPHYMEIATMLLNDVEDVVPHQEAERIRALLADIKHLRNSKIQQGVERLQSSAEWLKLNNVSAMELNEIRPFVLQALNNFKRLAAVEEPLDDEFDMGGSSSAAAAAAAAASASPSAGAVRDDDDENDMDVEEEAELEPRRPPTKLRRYRE